MEGLSLLMGHLLGDYVLQNDWQARHKASTPPEGPRPAASRPWPTVAGAAAQADWDRAALSARLAPWACTLHCALYTLACLATCRWFLPWWAYPVIFAAHWPVDRWRLARRWMSLAGQRRFAVEALAPWSVVVVDNVGHLAVLYVLGMLAVRGGW